MLQTGVDSPSEGWHYATRRRGEALVRSHLDRRAPAFVRCEAEEWVVRAGLTCDAVVPAVRHPRGASIEPLLPRATALLRDGLVVRSSFAQPGDRRGRSDVDMKSVFNPKRACAVPSRATSCPGATTGDA